MIIVFINGFYIQKVHGKANNVLRRRPAKNRRRLPT